MAESEQEFIRKLEEQLRQLKVADVLAQTVMTISQLAWQRLSGEGRDLEQARLAIDALRALVPVLKGSISTELSRDFQQAVANLQLAYAGAISQAESRAESAPGGEEAPAGGTRAPSGADAADAAAGAAGDAEAADTEAAASDAEAADAAGAAGDEPEGVAPAGEQPAAAPEGRDPGEEPPAEPVTES